MKMYKMMFACSAAILLAAAVVFAIDEKAVMDTARTEAAEAIMPETEAPPAMPAMLAKDANMCPRGMKMGMCCQMTPAEKMKCCGMSPAMVDRCAMMTTTQIMATDPAAMMAMKDKLMLTPEQMGKLDMIAKKAREDAAMVLTAQQSDMVSGMAATPVTMLEMHTMMMQKMKEKGMTAPAEATTSKAAAAVAEQTTCPITGKPINKMYSTVYKGKTIYFCCPMCKPIFEKAAEKYLDKLPQFAQ